MNGQLLDWRGRVEKAVGIKNTGTGPVSVEQRMTRKKGCLTSNSLRDGPGRCLEVSAGSSTKARLHPPCRGQPSRTPGSVWMPIGLSRNA